MKTNQNAVFPTCVGMNRKKQNRKTISGSVPHVCGDEPATKQTERVNTPCSPRVWG